MRLLPLVPILVIAIGCGSGMSNKGSDPRSVQVFPIGPSITALFPTNTPADSVPFTMTVNGAGFGTDAVVFWNGTPQRTFFMTAQQLAVQITATDVQIAGLVPVYVKTGGLTSNTLTFNVTIQ